jgi:hypothetical protein
VRSGAGRCREAGGAPAYWRGCSLCGPVFVAARNFARTWEGAPPRCTGRDGNRRDLAGCRPVSADGTEVGRQCRQDGLVPPAAAAGGTILPRLGSSPGAISTLRNLGWQSFRVLRRCAHGLGFGVVLRHVVAHLAAPAGLLATTFTKVDHDQGLFGLALVSFPRVMAQTPAVAPEAALAGDTQRYRAQQPRPGSPSRVSNGKGDDAGPGPIRARPTVQRDPGDELDNARYGASRHEDYARLLHAELVAERFRPQSAGFAWRLPVGDYVC